MSFEALHSGVQVGNRYRLHEEIGAGGMGKVFRGRDERLCRDVAIKIQKSSKDKNGSDERFLREARIGAKLSHPNLVRTYDYGTEAGFRFLVIELLHGQDLYDRLCEGPSLSINEIVAIAMQVSSGIETAHAQELVHRDLKPENVFLVGGASLAAKVVDFGIAISMDAASSLGRVTMDGTLLGSPLYMAPERFRDLPEGKPGDVYALGCVMYEMICGSPPFTADELGEVVARHLYAPVPDIRERRPETPGLLCELVLRCLAKEPGARPTMSQVHERLKAFESAKERGQASEERDSMLSFAEVTKVVGESRRVALYGGGGLEMLMTLRAAGFDVIDEDEVADGDALVCLDVPTDKIRDLVDTVSLVLADAVAGDTARVAELLRLGVEEVVSRPAEVSELTRKLRRAFRLRDRKRVGGR